MFVYFGHTVRLWVSNSLTRDRTHALLQWKGGVLNTGLPENFYMGHAYAKNDLLSPVKIHI